MPTPDPAPTPPRPEVLAFLTAAKEDPDDDTPRLVLADWLEERGDARGEFVRLQCRRGGSEDGPAREEELSRRHRPEWLGVLSEKGIRADFNRGLVTVSGSPRKLVSKRMASLPRSETFAWVDRLDFDNFMAGDLPKLASSPHWERLTRLGLSKSVYYADRLADPDGVGDGRGDWAPLGSLAVLSGLSELDLRCQDLGEPGVAALATADLEHLRALALNSNNLGDRGAARLAVRRPLPALERLNLNQNRIRAEGFAALAGWRGLASVRSLWLGFNYPGARGIAALVASPWLSELEELSLKCDQFGLPESFGPRRFGRDGAEALAGARTFPRLTRLRIGGNGVGPDGAKALASSTAFPELTDLDLSENQIGDEGAAALANSAALRNLKSLDLRFNQIGDRGVKALIDSPYLNQVTELNFRANREATPGALAALRERFGEGADVGHVRRV